MDGETDKMIERQMDGYTERWMNGLADEMIERQMDGCRGKQITQSEDR